MYPGTLQEPVPPWGKAWLGESGSARLVPCPVSIREHLAGKLLGNIGGPRLPCASCSHSERAPQAVAFVDLMRVLYREVCPLHFSTEWKTS